MKTLYLYILILLIVCSGSKLFSQDSSWIDPWRRTIIAIGEERSSRTIKGAREFGMVGTGVLMYLKVENTVVPCLVTAAHVFEKKSENWTPQKLRLRFYGSENKSFQEYVGIQLNLYANGQKQFINHSDSSVDLSLIRLDEVTLPLATDTMIKDNIAPLPYGAFAHEAELFEGAHILVYGFPGLLSRMCLLNQY